MTNIQTGYCTPQASAALRSKYTPASTKLGNMTTKDEHKLMRGQSEHCSPGSPKGSGGPNSYTWGRVGKHSVVIVPLPAGDCGLTTTAVTVQGLRSSLPHIRFGVLVGIGAGVPGERQLADGNVVVLRDIQLGDAVTPKRRPRLVKEIRGASWTATWNSSAIVLISRQGDRGFVRTRISPCEIFLSGSVPSVCFCILAARNRHRFRDMLARPDCIARRIDDQPDSGS
jgi:hypothetical protein